MHRAELRTAKGRPFVPDERMRAIPARAAVMGHAQLAAQSHLDGGGSYTLDVPQPVPAKLFWSILPDFRTAG